VTDGQLHVLVVRVGETRLALPMTHVEQTFRLGGRRVFNVAGQACLLFRGRTMPTQFIGETLGLVSDGEEGEAVIVWCGGRRMAFAVDDLIGQFTLDRYDLPALATSPFCTGALIADDGEIVPLLDPLVVAGVADAGRKNAVLTEMQQSALREVGNIGSGNAATALAAMLGKEVRIEYADSLLVSADEVAGLVGSPLETSAMVETPIAGGHGSVLMLFAGDAPRRLCALLGTSMDEEMGHSALREVGNILSSSYLTALQIMTGLALEPEPPKLDVDVLGSLLGAHLDPTTNAGDLIVLMRSSLGVGEGDDGFSFSFVPQMNDVQDLLRRLEASLDVAA
jgi:chemotaxis protein CheC